jgi:hypothetical protein
MPFNISNLVSTIENYGYLKTSNFEVYIQPPRMLFGGSSGNSLQTNEITNMQTFRIDQVKAPGISLISADVNRYGIGPTQKQPFNAQYSEITFSILCDAEGMIWQYWHNWINAIFEYNGTENAFFGQSQKTPTYLTEYKSNYSTIMQIVMYDPSGYTVQRINLYEAFPTALREVNLAWGETDTLVKINVTIAYSEYTVVNSSAEIPMPSRIF